MCLHEKEIRNRKYIKNKKNEGAVPPLPDERMRFIKVSCGNCIECRKEKAREWIVRLTEDIKKYKNGHMVTLTFSNESIKKIMEYEKTFTDKDGDKYKATIGELEGYNLDNEIATVGVRLFMERWRKKYKKSLRHWLVTELGHNGTKNIHLHGIVWTDESIEEIEKIWAYGYIWSGYYIHGKRIRTYVNGKTINYSVKYINKLNKEHRYYKPIILTSPGIGSNYIGTYNSRNNEYKGNKTDETYTTRTGHRIKLPKYYRDKLYTEEEKERMWMDKLDKEETWIMGEKISTKNGRENYYKILKWHRERNKEMGYGDDNKDAKRERYEHEMRKKYQSIRLAEITEEKRGASPLDPQVNSRIL